MRVYLLLLRRDQTDLLSLPHADMLTRFKEWAQSLHEKGVLRAVERLKASAEGTTVRRRDSMIADEGPYDGSKEAVIGFFLLEAADQAAAHAIARECPIL